MADRNSPQKHVWRAGIVLATADGLGTVAIMRRTAKSKTVVWRWQERFAKEGVGGLLEPSPALHHTFLRANPLACIEVDEITNFEVWTSVVVSGRYVELTKTVECGNEDGCSG